MNPIYPYIVLGLENESVTDEEVRIAYLERVRLYPPDQHPERFQEIHTAYAAIQTEQHRLLCRYEEPVPEWDHLPELFPANQGCPLISRKRVVDALREERLNELFAGNTP